MGAFLVLGRTEDQCCRMVAERLTREGREVLFLPEDRLLPQMALAWTPADGGGGIRFEGRDVRFSETAGILYRFYGIPLPAEEYGTADGRYICSEWNALWMAWLNAPPETRPGPVINRLQPDLWYKTQLNTPAVAALMPGLPFARPQMLVTTDPDAARAFWRSARGPVTYSALTGSAPYPIREEEDFEKMTTLNNTLPLHLTEQVLGKPCEAFVVGQSVTLVGPDGTLCGPASDDLVKRCAEVGTHLGLNFFQMSLLVGSDGGPHCLGLTRMPQFYGCGPEAQEEIAGRLAALLTGSGRKEGHA